jgi:hypothetical protein
LRSLRHESRSFIDGVGGSARGLRYTASIGGISFDLGSVNAVSVLSTRGGFLLCMTLEDERPGAGAHITALL